MIYYQKDAFVEQIQGIKSPIYTGEEGLDKVIKGFKTGIYDIIEKVFTGKAKKSTILRRVCKLSHNVLLLECKLSFNVRDIISSDVASKLNNIWVGRIESQEMLLCGIRHSIPMLIKEAKIKFLILNNLDLLKLDEDYSHEIGHLLHKLVWNNSAIVIISRTCPTHLEVERMEHNMQPDYTFSMESYEEGGGDVLYKMSL